MNKITFTDSYQNRTRKTKRWLGMLAFCMMLFGGQAMFAQDCEISVTISSSTWGDVTTWELLDGNNEAVLSGGPYEEGFSDTQTYTATTPPYTLSITIDDWFYCDNVIDYEVTVGGNIDISGTVEAVCGDIYTWNFPLETDLTDCIPDCPAPSGLTATDISMTGATLGWTSDGNDFEVEWGVQGFVQGSTDGTIVTGIDTNSYELTVTEGGNYDFYVRQICDDGESTWTSSNFFIPGLGDTCSAPIIVDVIPYTHSDDTANHGNNYDAADRPPLGGEQYIEGTGSEYYLTGNEVVYSFTPTEDGSYNFNTTMPTSNWHALWLFEGCPFTSIVARHTAISGNTRSLPEINLTAGTTYYVIIATWEDSPQTTPYTLEITQTLCPTPTNLSASDITSNSAVLNWEGTSDLYDIEWGEAGFEQGGTDSTLETGLEENNLSLDNLNADTAYEFYVRQDCGATDGPSEWVGPFNFTTEVSCEVPEDLLVTDITLSSAVLNWEGTSNLYDIEWGETGFEQGGTDSELETGLEANSFLLDNLEAETEYQFYVRQDCGDDGVSQWAGPFSFNTGYCLVSTVYDGDYISAFSTTEAIENATYSTSSQPAGSYADETAQIIEQVAGGSFDFSTTYEGGNNGTNIWIDWNNDLVFDDSEKEYSEFSGVNKTGTITIPEGTEAGDYRMRVRALWGSGSADPDACGENNWGSTIDFTVRVVEDETDPCDGITPPEIESPQSLDEGQTLADVIVTEGENLTWYTDEGLTETADTSEALTEGEYTFFVTQTVGDCTSEATEVVITVTLSLSEFDTTQLKVYPNPTNGELNISYTDTINQVEVYNLLGQKVITQNFESNDVSLNVSHLSNGSYILILHANGLKQQVKIVKK